MSIPPKEDLSKYDRELVELVAKTSWMPNPSVVAQVGKAVFPTQRYKKNHERFSRIEQDGVVRGMYDDNATPEWALFWAHGLNGTRPKGWTIAHVWQTSDDIESYTHLANLAMVPEALASLTDKTAPLTAYLRWHSWVKYGWKPSHEKEPVKPIHYDTITWRYFGDAGDPKALIRQRFSIHNNQRTQILRPIMEREGYL